MAAYLQSLALAFENPYEDRSTAQDVSDEEARANDDVNGISSQNNRARANLGACSRCRSQRIRCNITRPCQPCVESELAARCVGQLLRPVSEQMKAVSLLALLPEALMDYSTALYLRTLYSTTPFVSVERLHWHRRRLHSPPQHLESVCILAALCARLMLQVPYNPSAIVPNGRSFKEYGRMLLDVVLVIKAAVPQSDSPTYDQCLLAYMLSSCHDALSQHSLAFAAIREACTMCARIISLGAPEEQNHCSIENLYWVLLVTERAMSIHNLQHLITLRQNLNIAPPADYYRLKGFKHLIDLFRPIDSVFMTLFVGELPTSVVSPTYLESVEGKIRAAFTSTEELDSSQIALLAITKTWLIGGVWLINMRNGQLLARTEHQTKQLGWILQEARDILKILKTLPLECLWVHGVRLTERLYHLTSCLMGTLAGVPVNLLEPKYDEPKRSPYEDLAQLRDLIKQLPGGLDIYDPILHKQSREGHRHDADIVSGLT